MAGKPNLLIWLKGQDSATWQEYHICSNGLNAKILSHGLWLRILQIGWIIVIHHLCNIITVLYIEISMRIPKTQPVWCPGQITSVFPILFWRFSLRLLAMQWTEQWTLSISDETMVLYGMVWYGMVWYGMVDVNVGAWPGPAPPYLSIGRGRGKEAGARIDL